MLKKICADKKEKKWVGKIFIKSFEANFCVIL